MAGLDQPKLRPSSPDGPPISREKRVRQILDQTGAVLTDGHFLYTSGLHGDTYINKDAIYPHTQETKEICGMWAEDFKDADIEVVVGPAMGGVILANNTADALTLITGHDVPGVYAEKADKGFVFTRGYEEFVKGKRVLVVEDILTTGGSAKSVVEAVREIGGEVVGVAVIANRGGVKPQDLGVDILDSLMDIQMKAVRQGECQKCSEGIPINTRVGAGKKLASPQTSNS